MIVKNIIDEDFVNYKVPSMFIGTCMCDWKCLNEKGLDISICQNSSLSKQPNISIDNYSLCNRYINNSITSAIVFGGLEPMIQIDDIIIFIKILRNDFNCNDDVVIYTGYYPDEITDKIHRISTFKNVVIKFGRFIPGSNSRFDNILGVTLSSENQFARRIS